MKALFILLISVCLYFFLPELLIAGNIIVEPPKSIDIPKPDDVSTIIPGIIAYFISLTAVLAILGVTWGAIKMILAAGEDEKVKKGRLIIIYSFVGLLVSGLAYSVVTVITQLNFTK
ncbi:hypothetical protein KBD33_02335 [Candidatus Gracilibacteria bacterium]|nr:hypothetical protein [Candidatus Gracilibacteria bacterium]